MSNWRDNGRRNSWNNSSMAGEKLDNISLVAFGLVWQIVARLCAVSRIGCWRCYLREKKQISQCSFEWSRGNTYHQVCPAQMSISPVWHRQTFHCWFWYSCRFAVETLSNVRILLECRFLKHEIWNALASSSFVISTFVCFYFLIKKNRNK